MKGIQIFQKLGNVFRVLYEKAIKRYPFTIGAVWIVTILYAFTDGLLEWMPADIRENMEIFGLMFAVGALFTEEYFHDKKKQIPGFLISSGLAGYLVYIYRHGESLFQGPNHEWILQTIAKCYGIYVGWMLLASVYRMYRKSQETFPKYCTAVFGNVMRTGIVYGIFALGIAAIFEVIDILLFDIGNMLYEVEILLFGGIFVPGILLAVSNVKSEIGKFLRFVVKFVFLPLLLAAFLILYLYIVKMIVTWEIPSNEVFAILTALFACGLPIWTMSFSLPEDRLIKIAKKLPFAFLPFVILQGFSIGLRISQYGMTDRRYLAIYFLIFEVIYVVLYALKKGEYVPYALLIPPFMAIFFLLVPGVEYDSVVYRSQMARAKQYLSLSIDELENLPDSDKAVLGGAYRELHYTHKGKLYFENLDEEYVDKLDSFANVNTAYDDAVYIHASANRISLKVDGYSVVERVDPDYQTEQRPDAVCIKNENGFETTVDLTEFLEKLCQAYETNHRDMDEWLESNGEILIGNNEKFLLSYVYVTKRHDEYENIRVSGYYFK